ncbi:hypothetical protein ACFLQI_02850 [Candidatus Undinarchaeota archaeon]
MPLKHKLADYLPSDWKVYAFTAVALLSLAFYFIILGLIQFAGMLKLLFLFISLTILIIIMRFPERISEVGGTDIELVLIAYMGAFYGPTIGALFGFISTATSEYFTVNTPQYRIAETIAHTIVGFVAGMWLILSPENYMMVLMLFVVISHVISRPICIALGCPFVPQLGYGLVNILWSYVIIRQFGLYLFTIFA